MKNLAKFTVISLLLFGGLVFGATAAPAPDPVKDEILDLSDSVSEKKGKLSELQSKIDEYKKLISSKQSEQITLANQISLLENRIAKSALDIEATNLEIDTVNDEILLLENQIAVYEAKIENEKTIIGELLRNIKSYDDRSALELLLSNDKFSDFYAQLNFLENVQNNLQETLDEVQSAKDKQVEARENQQSRRLALEDLKNTLIKEQALIEEEQGTKEYLLLNAQSSESRFQSLLNQLRQESQFIDTQVSSLEEQLSKKLRDYDVDFSGGTMFSWPATGVITAYFHDPSYPFRYLFEHSGLDIALGMGTPVAASAPGIVAVAKTGTSYGNYVVIIHSNGLSTLYAHLSKILVSPEKFVERGDTIGLSGGCKGCKGAGFSTGPHLHFEVREHGVPVNPSDYLVDF